VQTTYFPLQDLTSGSLPIYLSSIGYDYVEGHMHRPDGYSRYQWVHTTSGEGELSLHGRLYSLPVGHGMFLYPNVPHTYYPKSNQWITEWLSFDGKDIAQLVDAIGFHSSGVYQLDYLDQFKNHLREGYRLATSTNQYSSLDMSAFLYNFLIELIKNVKPLHKTSRSNQYDKLLPVLLYLDVHYSQPMVLEILAELIQVSPQYLCTLFKKVFNTRPSAYLNHLRINKAKEIMLTQPHKSISQIAKEVGIESPSYFSALFKKHEGKTPNDFISLHRPQYD